MDGLEKKKKGGRKLDCFRHRKLKVCTRSLARGSCTYGLHRYSTLYAYVGRVDVPVPVRCTYSSKAISKELPLVLPAQTAILGLLLLNSGSPDLSDVRYLVLFPSCSCTTHFNSARLTVQSRLVYYVHIITRQGGAQRTIQFRDGNTSLLSSYVAS